MTSRNSFGSQDTLTVDGTPYRVYRLDRLHDHAGSTVRGCPAACYRPARR